MKHALFEFLNSLNLSSFRMGGNREARDKKLMRKIAFFAFTGFSTWWMAIFRRVCVP